MERILPRTGFFVKMNQIVGGSTERELVSRWARFPPAARSLAYREPVTEAPGPAARVPWHVPARVRVPLAAFGGALAYGLMALVTPWQVAALVGWDVMAAALLVWVWWTIRGSDSDRTASIAKMEDPPSRPLVDLMLVTASVASLLGVGFALVKASRAGGLAQVWITAIAVVTVALSWLSVHAVYTLRYADLYYAAEGGIGFHHDRAPDYGDFAYVAYTIGMTYQVSDFDLVSRRIQRTALRHALVS